MAPRDLLMLGIASAAVATFFTGLTLDLVWLRVVVKPLPVLCMAAMALWSPAPSSYRRALAVGLLLSALGDLFLELPGDHFVAGLVAFLVAHFFYVVAFVGADTRLRAGMALPFALFGAGIFLYLQPSLGELATPVAVYVAVICVMGWRAAARLGGGRIAAAGAGSAVVGAILFIASDAVLAVNKFEFDGELPGGRELNISAYWLGQLFIAMSAVRGNEEHRA